MTEDLYPIRLSFYNGCGVAKFDGRRRVLLSPPPLGFSFVEIDYAPRVCQQVRPTAAEPVREMYPAEVAACVKFVCSIDDHAA